MDNNENNKVSAAALYRRYQKARPTSGHTRPDPDVARSVQKTQNTTSDKPAISESHYRHYQQNRATTTEASIDSVMRAIDDQSIDNILQKNKHPIISDGVPDIRPVSAKQGQVDANLVLADAPAANTSTSYKRLILPTIAAAILGIVLIPLVLDKASKKVMVQATLPAALIAQATQAVALIDSPASEAFGFSDTSDAAKVAFNNGVNVTDLHLLMEADQIASAAPFLKAMISQTDIRSTTKQLIETIDVGASNDVVKTHLNDLTLKIQDSSNQARQLDWFLVGRSVESIKIAAEFALEHSETQSLEQALTLASKLDRPANMQGVGGLLDELFQARLTSPDEFLQASKILITANDIKVLMQ